MMKDDLLKLFDDFYKQGSFVKLLNATFLVLIVKKKKRFFLRISDPLAWLGVSTNLYLRFWQQEWRMF